MHRLYFYPSNPSLFYDQANSDGKFELVEDATVVEISWEKVQIEEIWSVT